MSAVRNPISEVAELLRKQRDVPLWVVADSPTILSIAKDEPLKFGPRGRWLNALFNRLGATWFGLHALRAIAIGCVSLWWFKSLRVSKSNAYVKELFIGFGAGPEQEMFERFQAEGSRVISRIDQTRPELLATVTRPKLWTLWRNGWVESGRIFSGLRCSSCSHVNKFVEQWLTVAAIKIGIYAYFKSWAECLPGSISRVVFVSPDIPAFALIDVAKSNVDMVVEFWQHGLLRKSLIIPEFRKVLALNRPEAEFIKTANSAAEINLVSVSMKDVQSFPCPVVLLPSLYTSPEFDKRNHVKLLKDLFLWAQEQKMEVVVRPHPCENQEFWREFFPGISLDQSRGGFVECLDHRQPSFVISWFSTTLLDALKNGILPVLIMPGSEQALADIVFPLDKVAMKWPEEKDHLGTILSDQDQYCEQVLLRQKMAFGKQGIGP